MPSRRILIMFVKYFVVSTGILGGTLGVLYLVALFAHAIQSGAIPAWVGSVSLFILACLFSAATITWIVHDD